MNHGNVPVTTATSAGLMDCECPSEGQGGNPLGTTVERTGPRRPLTGCEVETFLMLVPGSRIFALDPDSGEVWRGWVDTPFLEHGFVWVFTDLGERKLIDIAVHRISQPDNRYACGNERPEHGKA